MVRTCTLANMNIDNTKLYDWFRLLGERAEKYLAELAPIALKNMEKRPPSAYIGCLGFLLAASAGISCNGPMKAS